MCCIAVVGSSLKIVLNSKNLKYSQSGHIYLLIQCICLLNFREISKEIIKKQYFLHVLTDTKFIHTKTRQWEEDTERQKNTIIFIYDVI